ncbi:MAG: hypothetical protein DI598_07320 [Pseudopedobacter saltans]|uniref:DUF4302 domain-containing protein n=1 Tax=Pseudopedobacter saltans TaxID=151895 RepID=A0A2W5F7N7_9SPHI|nr:MAG: hypothetical protein DI598_07320 [Pseudopedobacter saltans]
MKKIIYLLLTCFLFSCVKHDVDLVFDQLPEARMLARNKELQNKLSESPGWKGFLRTSLLGTGYGFYMTFDSSKGQVTMYSDWNSTYATTPKTSSYSIIYEMNTTLVFDTYNYITILQDPNSSVNGGNLSTGLRSDIEFAYIRSTNDTIVLQGKHYSNYLYLVKATTTEATKYANGSYSSSITTMSRYFSDHANSYFPLSYNGNDVKVGIVDLNTDTKSIIVAAKVGDSVASAITSFGFSIDGAYFTNAFTILGKTFIALRYKDDGSMYIVDNEGNEFKMLQNTSPLFTLQDIFGYNKIFNSIYNYGPGTLASQAPLPTGVTSGFNSVYNNMLTRFSLGARFIDTVDFRFVNSTSAYITIWYWSGTTHFSADASFNYTYANNVLTLTNYIPSASNTNWTTRITEIGSFATWWQGGPFNVNWVSSPSIPGIYQVANPSSFYYGRLRKR